MAFDGGVLLNASFIPPCSQHGWLHFEKELMTVDQEAGKQSNNPWSARIPAR